MPYPNEHAARINDPSDYDEFARKKIAPGIDAIFGIKEGKSEIQAYRFDSKKFTPEQAQKWLDEHKIKPIDFEDAVEETEVKAKIAVTKLEGVELLYAGSFKPVNWAGKAWEVSAATLQEIVDNTNARIKAGIYAQAIIDHDVNNDGVLEAMKSLSFGNVVGLTLEERANGYTIVSTFDNVPEKFADLVHADLLGKRSIEVRSDESGLYLDAVAFFGSGKPAVAGLNSLADNLFRTDDGKRIAAKGEEALLSPDSGMIVYLQDNDKVVKEVLPMPDTDNGKLAELEAENVKLKADAELAIQLKDAKDSMESELIKLKAEAVEMASKLQALDEEKAAFILLREREEEAKVVDWVEGEVAAGHVLPAKKDSVVAMLRSLTEDHKAVAMELISCKEKNVLLTEKVPSIDSPKSYDDVKLRVASWLQENNMPDTLDNYAKAIRVLGLSQEV